VIVIDDRQAATITVDDAVKGRVESVLDANRLVVMGQTVLLDNRTVRANGVVPAVGDYLEVHGLPSGEGEITAGFIEHKKTLPTPPFAVKGGITVQTSSLTEFDNVGSIAGLAAGNHVRIKARPCAGGSVLPSRWSCVAPRATRA
jgi:hypothetical protein